MASFIASAFVLALSATSALADNTVTCGPGSLCPSDTPCCSQYGQCGVGAYCLGGCNPLFSNALDSCVPEPVCKSQNIKMNSLDGIVPNTQYLGDASNATWVSSGTPLAYNGSVLLTMPQNSVGTLLASTAYVWYGKVSATLKTSHDAGVVTAFILLSDVLDEIDYEFVGVELTTAQTNFYSQGVTNYNNGGNATVSDTFENFHTYEFDWTPDSITWSIDGNPVRVKNRNDTWNATANRYDYPQTPARVQCSLWPAGLPTNGEGTIQWSGGEISWDTPDVKNNGYYYATFSEVDIQCYDPPQGANVSGTKSYIYTDPAGTNNTVATTNDNTVLKSLLGTGTNMSANYPSAASASSSASTSEVAQVPGLSGAGSGSNGQRGGSSGSSNAGASGASSGAGSASTGFVQGSGSSGSGSGKSGAPKTTGGLQGSLFAVLVAIVGLMAM